ncbi:MAG TPA: hypothetical protein PLB78_14965, partial [Anaerolineae bacterium]|nr:hypothetical protein [Anaerolineae bacterium]
AEGRPTPLVPPKDRFWADPHVIRTGDTYHVFLEEYLYNAGKGRISVMQIDDRGTVTGPTPVLEEEHHLSYPSVFSWEGRYYMVPESAHRRTIDLYEGIEFPWKWQFRMHLMENVRAVDSTIFSHQGTWWLFTGIAEHEGAFPQVELFLFFSNELFTNRWQPHPMNPIVSDVKRARPAGSVFSQGGRIIRPSQDCSRRYGYGFDLNEIVALSETEYAERPLASVRPRSHSRALATHTYARDGRLTMIDACMRRSRLF